MNFLKNAALKTLVLFGLSTFVWAGQFSLGGEFQGWTSNFAQPAVYNGYEVWAPMSLSFGLGGGLEFFALSELGNAGYTSQVSSNTTYFTAFSDTMAGAELKFKSFALPSLLSIGVNIPTGDPTWEKTQIVSNIPTQFIDSRYRGRGLGVNAMYGLSFPAGTGSFGAAVGYQYAGSYNPDGILGTAEDDLKLGDAMFLALNNVQPFSNHQSQVIRLSAFAFLPTQLGGVNALELGPNVNVSYGWYNPGALSFEIGAQYYFPSQRNDPLVMDAHSVYGPRIYLNPSYAIGDFSLAGRVKYIFANDFSANSTDATESSLYNGGGYLLGLEPSFRLKLDEGSALKLYGSYDFIDAQGAGWADLAETTRADILYNRWTVGTSYQIKI